MKEEYLPKKNWESIWAKYRLFCPNCGKKWRGYWRRYHGIGFNTFGSGSRSFIICPNCHYHFVVQVPIMPNRMPIPFGEESKK